MKVFLRVFFPGWSPEGYWFLTTNHNSGPRYYWGGAVHDSIYEGDQWGYFRTECDAREYAKQQGIQITEEGD